MKCELISINRAFDHLPTGISIIFSVESRHQKMGFYRLNNTINECVKYVETKRIIITQTRSVPWHSSESDTIVHTQ